MIKKMSKETEQKLLNCLDQIMDEMGDIDGNPNDVIAKVASEHKLLPNQISLLVKAYNNGKTNVIRKQANTVEDKLAKFPLADTKKVLDKIYNPKSYENNKGKPNLNNEVEKEDEDDAEKNIFEGVSKDKKKDEVEDGAEEALSAETQKISEILDDWKKAEDKKNLDKQQLIQTKLAEYKPQKYKISDITIGNEYDRLHSEISKLEDLIWEQRQLLHKNNTKLARSVENLVSYFSNPGSENIESVFCKVASFFGEKIAESILNPVYEELKDCYNMVKFAEDFEFHINNPVDWSKKPYNDILDGIEAYISVNKCRDVIVKISSDFNKCKDKINEAFAKLSGITFFTDNEKNQTDNIKNSSYSNDNDTFSTSVKDLFFDPLLKKEDKNKLIDLAEPDLKLKKNKMEKEILLNKLVNQDEVIKSYDKKEIADIYNQLQTIAPLLTNKEMILKSLLRKYLAQGGIDVHEVKQLVDLNESMKTDPRKIAVILREKGLVA